MKKNIKDYADIKSTFYDIRSLIYTLLVGACLLLLLNLKQLNIDSVFYFFIAALLLITALSEFTFTVNYSGKVYTKEHALYKIFKQFRIHHFYNILLLPVIQYLTCAAIIYYNDNQPINFLLVLITVVFSFFIFNEYKNLYINNLKVNAHSQEFFDVSRYVSFAFVTYLIFIMQKTAPFPRSFSAVLIGLIQFIYLLATLWRREKLNVKTAFGALILSAALSIIVYIFLQVYTSETIGITLVLTTQTVIVDYLISSLFIKKLQKRLNFWVAMEYLLVAMIDLSILYFARH